MTKALLHQPTPAIDANPAEPWGANILRIEASLVLNAAYPRRAGKIENLGYSCRRVDISEFVKAEAGLPCMSRIFN